MLYNTVLICFSLAFFFLLLCTKTFKEKEHRNKFHVVMKRNKVKQQQTELWSNATMQQVALGVISNMTFFGKTCSNNNLLSIRKLKDS